MQSKQIKIVLGAVLVAILVFQGICIAAGFNKNREQDRTIHRLQTQQNQAPQDGLSALNAIGMNQPAVSVTDKKVYLPELKLALPLSNESLSLLYSSRQVGSDQKSTTYDVTNRALAALPAAGFQQQFACTPVRLAFEAKANPYNPKEKTNPAITLADGRVLQVYTYTNDACTMQWKAANVNPSALADLFAKATSY